MVSDVVKKETGFILLGAVILSVIMELVFLVLGFWDYTVLLGNILSTAVCTLSFFLMGLTVQKAVGMEEEDARRRMKGSHSLRYLMIIVVVVLGAVLPWFNIIALLIPLFFNRITVPIRSAIHRRRHPEEMAVRNPADGDGYEDYDEDYGEYEDEEEEEDQE
ncbi:MAG: ATP synthase subunit I [Oscillospiraceae bacterium]|nr:ATP synthase subunit I [Oscillospiraceae bacterium]